jgi:hypothetical protein
MASKVASDARRAEAGSLPSKDPGDIEGFASQADILRVFSRAKGGAAAGAVAKEEVVEEGVGALRQGEGVRERCSLFVPS